MHDPAFAKFLRLRADALLSDDYFPSDLAWLDLKNPKFDIIFAPYETYMDGLLGVKGSYGAAVMVRNERESKKLDLFQKYVADIQDALPLAPEDRPSKHGLETPMEVMDTPFRAGDLTHGYQAVADNLPNDPRVHEQKGSKKLFFKNFMDARVNYVILPVARKLMEPEQAAKVSGEGYLQSTIMHEICHGLGSGIRADVCGKSQHSRSHRPPVQRTGRSESRRLRHVRPEVAGRSRRPAERKAGRILCVLRWGNLPHSSLRNRRGPRASRDDGIQLSLRTAAQSGETPTAATRSTTRKCRARLPRWQKNYSKLKPPAIASEPKTGSRSMDRCRKN